MQKWELHAMLATIVLNPLYNRQKLNSLSFDKPDLRAVQISVNFIRTYGIVFATLAACGYPVYMPEVSKCLSHELFLFLRMDFYHECILFSFRKSLRYHLNHDYFK